MLKKKDPEEFMKEEEVEEVVAPTPTKTREVASNANEADNGEGFAAVGKGGKTIVAVSKETLLTRLREVLESRGKKVKKKIYIYVFIRIYIVVLPYRY